MPKFIIVLIIVAVSYFIATHLNILIEWITDIIPDLGPCNEVAEIIIQLTVVYLISKGGYLIIKKLFY